jgi:ribosomal protein S12 methylthiotransferase
MSKKSKRPLNVGFVALGCPKNMVDSEKMLAEIAQAGFIIDPEPNNADIVVINTCGFIAPAKAEALEAINHTLDCKRKGFVKKVIVAGCLPQRMGDELFGQADGIDAIVGLGQRDQIAQIIKKTINAKHPQAYMGHSCGVTHDDRARLLITPGHWAYLRISEGCDHRCSFCTIPVIRGRFRSKPPELVLAEAAELASAGVAELNVIAQDTTGYGRDLKIKNGLASILTELEKIPQLKWIRLMYLYPAGITKKLIETIAESKKVVRYLDIPIQHVNDQILKQMRRPDTSEQIRKTIESLRKNLPDVVLRTTLIVGFPGETDQQFEELVDFIKWAQFDALGCFKYYPESGTAAAEMPNQLPDNIKQQRMEKLMLAQQEIAFSKNENRLESELTCLVDSVDSLGNGKGRFYGQAPDIDSICIISNCSAKPGDFINTRVVGTKDYDLIVRQI